MSGAAARAQGAEGRYWEALEEGRLELPRCKGCGRWHWPAVWRCGACGSWEHEWLEAPLSGAVFTWTRTWQPFGGAEEIGVPFVTLVVTLDGPSGLRMLGLLEGDTEKVAIGARVEGRIGETTVWGETMPALRWRLIDA